jgi:hypothetical protein
MTLGGGGWTAFFVGTLGYQNEWGYFDYPSDDCPLPALRCVRHLPSTVTIANQFAARCGSAAVAFEVGANGLDYFRHGTQNGWQVMTNVIALAGNANPMYASKLFTGFPGNMGWILSADDNEPHATPNTFASSYNNFYDGQSGLPYWDYCNGVDYRVPVWDDAGKPPPSTEAGAWPMVWLFYR